MTYQGSLPFPACYETVTWIILNQPVIITETQLKSLRQLRISSFRESGRMADNYRTIQKLNNRSVRTNIDFIQTQPYCSMQSRRSYIGKFKIHFVY
uniref:Carbonic anhydrase-related protein 10 n=1 Tax=Schistosoma haematobium TaxID=6185 RepID=A0A095A4J9_SCHHA